MGKPESPGLWEQREVREASAPKCGRAEKVMPGMKRGRSGLFSVGLTIPVLSLGVEVACPCWAWEKTCWFLWGKPCTCTAPQQRQRACQLPAGCLPRAPSPAPPRALLEVQEEPLVLKPELWVGRRCPQVIA